MEKKVINTIISVTWAVILIILWTTFQWLPGNIFVWMWIAIGWSALGGVFGSIYYAAKSKRNLIIVCIIGIAILVFFWMNYILNFIPGADFEQWHWVTISFTIAVGIILVGILIMKLLKKTEW